MKMMNKFKLSGRESGKNHGLILTILCLVAFSVVVPTFFLGKGWVLFGLLIVCVLPGVFIPLAFFDYPFYVIIHNDKTILYDPRLDRFNYPDPFSRLSSLIYFMLLLPILFSFAIAFESEKIEAMIFAGRVALVFTALLIAYVLIIIVYNKRAFKSKVLDIDDIVAVYHSQKTEVVKTKKGDYHLGEHGPGLVTFELADTRVVEFTIDDSRFEALMDEIPKLKTRFKETDVCELYDKVIEAEMEKDEEPGLGPEEREFRQIHRKRRKLILFFICLSLVVLHFYFKYWCLRELKSEIPQDKYTAILNSMDKILDIPEAYRNVDMPTPEVAKAVDEIHYIWLSSEKYKYNEIAKIIEQLESDIKDKDEFRKRRCVVYLREYKDDTQFIDKINKLVKMEGYKYEYFVPPIGVEYSGYREMTDHALNIIEEKSYSYYINNEYNNAIDEILNGFYLARKNPVGSMKNGSVCDSYIRNISDMLLTIMDTYKEKDCLNSVLSEMNNLECEYFHATQLEGVELDIVASLHGLYRMGYEINLGKEKSVGNWYKWSIKKSFLLDINEDEIIFDDNNREVHIKPPGLFQKSLSRLFGYSIITEWIYVSHVQRSGVYKLWELYTRSIYDLTRLNLAGRIRELNGEELLKDVDEFPVEMIPAGLRDPFSEEKYRWSGDKSTFYSFGPDKVDNGCAEMYDPTNGTVSTGDIWIEKVEKQNSEEE